jgi:excisionase family DNA binding protein
MDQQTGEELKTDLGHFSDCIENGVKNALESGKRFASRLIDTWLEISAGKEMGTARTEETPRLLTVKEVAAYLHVTDRAIYAWVRQGKLIPERAGNKLLFHLADIDAWIKAQPKTIERTRLRMVK